MVNHVEKGMTYSSVHLTRVRRRQSPNVRKGGGLVFNRLRCTSKIYRDLLYCRARGCSERTATRMFR